MTPPVAAGSAEPPVPPGKRSAEEMEGSPEPRPGSPPPQRSREQSGSCDPSPVFRICQHLVGLSRVNNECSPWCEKLGDEEVARLGLPDLYDVVWAVLTFRTSLRGSFSLYVRLSRASHFADNTLCTRQLVLGGAVLGLYLSPPQIRLADGVFPLVENPREGDSLVVDELFPLNQGWSGNSVRHPRLFDKPDMFLCLPLRECELPFDVVRNPQLDGHVHGWFLRHQQSAGLRALRPPLQPSNWQLPAYRNASFLTRGHWVPSSLAARSEGEKILALAGLRTGDMNDFLDHHDEGDGDYPLWLLGLLAHVRHHLHLPREIPVLQPVPTWAAEDDRPTSVLPPGVMFTSSFHRDALLARLWMSFPCANGAPLVPDSFFRNPPAAPPTVSAELIQVRARGFIDPHASRAYISKRFAEDLGLNIGAANRRITGPIHELQTRSGGWHTVSRSDHRLQLSGVGEIPLVVNFARAGQPARWATVHFMVVEDGPLPRGSSTEFVLHWPFANAFKDWIRDASHCDIVTQASQQSALALPRFVVPRAAPSEPASPASGSTERYHPIVRSLTPTESTDLPEPAATQTNAPQDSKMYSAFDCAGFFSQNRLGDRDSCMSALGECPGDGFFARGALHFKTGFAADRLCVSCPEARVAIVTRLHHSEHSGHYGPVATAARVQAGYYWPQMWSEIRAFVYSCVACQL